MWLSCLFGSRCLFDEAYIEHLIKERIETRNQRSFFTDRIDPQGLRIRSCGTRSYRLGSSERRLSVNPLSLVDDRVEESRLLTNESTAPLTTRVTSHQLSEGDSISFPLSEHKQLTGGLTRKNLRLLLRACERLKQENNPVSYQRYASAIMKHLDDLTNQEYQKYGADAVDVNSIGRTNFSVQLRGQQHQLNSSCDTLR